MSDRPFIWIQCRNEVEAHNLCAGVHGACVPECPGAMPCSCPCHEVGLDYKTVDDSPATQVGAVQFVDCGFCGALAGRPCVVSVSPSKPLVNVSNFAHIARRAEYVQWRDVFGPPVKKSTEDLADLLG